MIGYKADPIIACNFSVIFEELGLDFNLPSPGGGNPNRVGFSKVFGLDQEIEVTEVVQGSYPETVYIPGRIKHGAVTFERGMSTAPSGQALYQWFRETLDLLYTQIVPESDAWLALEDASGFHGGNARRVIRKRDVTIEIPVRPQAYSPAFPTGIQPRNTIDGRSIFSGVIPGITIKLIQAWPTKFSLGPLDASTNTVWISSMELRHIGMSVEYNVG
jgi:phage tail-like protein